MRRKYLNHLSCGRESFPTIVQFFQVHETKILALFAKRTEAIFIKLLRLKKHLSICLLAFLEPGNAGSVNICSSQFFIRKYYRNYYTAAILLSSFAWINRDQNLRSKWEQGMNFYVRLYRITFVWISLELSETAWIKIFKIFCPRPPK